MRTTLIAGAFLALSATACSNDTPNTGGYVEKESSAEEIAASKAAYAADLAASEAAAEKRQAEEAAFVEKIGLPTSEAEFKAAFDSELERAIASVQAKVDAAMEKDEYYAGPELQQLAELKSWQGRGFNTRHGKNYDGEFEVTYRFATTSDNQFYYSNYQMVDTFTTCTIGDAEVSAISEKIGIYTYNEPMESFKELSTDVTQQSIIDRIIIKAAAQTREARFERAGVHAVATIERGRGYTTTSCAPSVAPE